jgi:Aromatic-ring-opening dioxygenase LigAB, LigA subunit
MVNRVLYDLARRADARAAVAAKAAFLDRYPLSADQRAALSDPDWVHLLALGALPNLVYRYYVLHGHAPESFPEAIAGRTLVC